MESPAHSKASAARRRSFSVRAYLSPISLTMCVAPENLSVTQRT
jgi:hypothetical protein